MTHSNLDYSPKILYLLLLIVFISVQHIIQKLLSGPFFILITVFIFVMPVLPIHKMIKKVKEIFKESTKLNILFILTFLLSIFFLFQLFYGDTFKMTSIGLLYIIPAIYIAGLFIMKFNKISLLLIALVISIYHYFVLFPKYQIGYSGDMLEYIQSAIAMSIKGENPFQHIVPVREYTYPFFGYGPLFITIYSIPFTLGIDLRFINLIFYLIFILILSRFVRSNFSYTVTITLTLFPWIHYLILTKHIFFYGILIILADFFTKKGNNILSSLFSTLIFLSRQFAVILSFYNWVHIKKYKHKIYWVIVSILVFFGIFLFYAPEDFWSSIQNVYLPQTSGLTDHFFNTSVDFSSNRSPGGGSGFNISHLLKYYIPSLRATHCMIIFIIVSVIILTLFILKKISVHSAQYTTYISFIFLSYNYSPYFLWGVICVLLADILFVFKSNENTENDFNWFFPKNSFG